MRSTVGKDRWSTLTAAGAVFGGLWAHGDDVLVETGATSTRPSRLLVSRDQGTTFASYAAPPSVACRFEEPAAAVVWADCSTGRLSGVWRSADYGAHFAPASAGRGHHPLPVQPNSAAFAAASATTAVVGFQRLYRTADGGASYRPVGPHRISWQYLGVHRRHPRGRARIRGLRGPEPRAPVRHDRRRAQLPPREDRLRWRRRQTPPFT